MNIHDKKLLPHQKKLIRSTKPTKVMICGRAAGKTFVAGRLIGLRLMSGYNVLVTAQTYKTLKKVLFGTTIGVLKKWGLKISINHNDMTITLLSNGAHADFYTANNNSIENVRGLSDYKTWVADEAALASKEFHDVIYACLRGQGDPEEVLITTPKGARNWLSQYIKTLPPEQVEIIKATTYDNNKLSPIYLKNLERSYTSSFAAQELMGEILDADESDQLISWVALETAAKVLSPSMDGDRVLGIDMARWGDDTVQVYNRTGAKVTHVFEASKNDSFALFNKVTRLYKPSDLDVINIDGTGGSNSSGLVDLLTRAGYRVNEVNFSHAAPLKDKYVNLRAFMYACVNEALKLGLSLPDDDKLMEELAAIKYKVRESDGRIILIPKDEIRKVLGRSPDRADGVALTFAHCIDFDKLFSTEYSESIAEETESSSELLRSLVAASAW